MPESVTDRPTTATEMVFLLTKAPEYFYDAFAIREAGAQPDRQRADRFGGANGHEVRHGLGAISEGHQTRNKLNWWRVNPGGSSWEYCRHCARLFEGPERGRIKKRVEKDGEGNERTVRYCPECGATDGWVDHFAAFPPALVEPMIRVGSSERCCAECGEPWQRLVEKEVKPHPNRWSKKADALQYSQSENDYAEGGTLGQSIETRTVGFSPSCACASAAPPVPGIVLDPFAGSGTTLCVALAHGRRAVGIELNEGYAAVARARCERAARLAGATTPSLFGEEPA